MRTCLGVLLFGVPLLAFATSPAAAQGSRLSRAVPIPLRLPPPPGSVITGIDIPANRASGRELSTGYTFTFKVLIPDSAAAVLSRVTIGQKIWADLKRKGVEVDYGKLCCGILEESDH
jgi:hypothetical protein